MPLNVQQSSPLFSEGDLKGLRDQVPSFKRNKSWIGAEGLSPLHLAALYNQPEMCEVLLEEGITPDVTEPFTGKTPLHIAAYYGHLDVARVLERFWANLDVRDCVHCSPIHYAAMGLHKEVILFFLMHRIPISLQSSFGNVLDILIRKESLELTDFFSNINGAEALDRFYCSPYDIARSIADRSWTPFHSAAISSQSEIFEMLYNKFPFIPSSEEENLKLAEGNVEDYIEESSGTSIADAAVLGGDPSIKALLGLKEDSTQYRKVFLERNWYETPVPERKELCDAIRYRQMDKLNDIIQSKGQEVLFEREKRARSGISWEPPEKPNALDLGGLLYSLPFFDYLIETSIEMPDEEFMIPDRKRELFFNWALMGVHPHGEGFLKRLG